MPFAGFRGRQLQLFALGLLLTVIVRVPNRRHADGVDRHFEGARKRWAFLNETITHEAETALLRVNARFVVRGPVLEVKHEAARDANAAGRLEQIAVGERCSVGRAELEEPVDQSLREAHRYRHAACRHRADQDAADERCDRE